MLVTSPKIVTNLPITMRSYTVKENPIDSAVSEILRYKQTNKQTNILLLYYKLLKVKIVYIHTRFVRPTEKNSLIR